jgi:hypothetical protein
MEKHGDALPWEQVHLHTDKNTFLKVAPPLMGVEIEVPEKVACKDQSFLSVPDLDEKTVVERPAGRHALSNCRVQSTIAAQSSLLFEILGEFVDNRLSRISYRFRAEERARVLSLLRTRFGKGDDITLEEQSMIELKETQYHYWRDADQIWLLRASETETVLLIQQDLEAGKKLSLPKGASKRGEPVSLDDIGIGKLDLKAPLPTLDLPDAGAVLPSGKTQ